MVQVISLLDTKELKPQKTNIKIDTNVDFLELLMKDIKDKNSDIVDEKIIVPNIKNEKKDTKISLKSLDDVLKSSKDEKKDKNENILKEDIKQEIKIKDLDFVITNLDIAKNDKKKLKNSIIKEIKNIIDSKIKQQNILLTKSEIKEFKKIDNIKDLIKFADKKGLNIKNIKIELPKENVKSFNDFNNKKLPSNEILKNNLIYKNKIVNQKNKEQTITLEDVLKKDKKETLLKTKNEIKKVEKIKIDTNTDTKEIKTEKVKIKDKKIEQKIDLISILNQKTEKTKSKNIEPHIKEHEEKIKQVKIETKVEKQENIIQNNQLNNINEIKAKSIQAKQTIDSFKNNLDEAIKNYKPPISKVNIELNPKNLGKVEVTIIQRGNNIHVNMNTDQNNIILFQTHQAEFRQALANIGFSNIDMSFNSNQDKERKQNQAKKSYKENEKQEIGEIEIKAEYKYA